MKPLRLRLQEARRRLRLPWEVLERDYLLSWVLAGIGQVDSLQATLVFKGGTALKKCYFGDYRFSEDLDFSALEGVPTGEAMERAVQEACTIASKLLDEYAPVEIVCERYTVSSGSTGKAFTEGVETHVLDGVNVRVYGAAKTVADCFKYRNKIGLDTAIESLRLFLKEKRGSPDELVRFARVCRVEKVIRPYIEALL